MSSLTASTPVQITWLPLLKFLHHNIRQLFVRFWVLPPGSAGFYQSTQQCFCRTTLNKYSTWIQMDWCRNYILITSKQCSSITQHLPSTTLNYQHSSKQVPKTMVWELFWHCCTSTMYDTWLLLLITPWLQLRGSTLLQEKSITCVWTFKSQKTW